MKRLLFGFFQVLCLLQLFGPAQLNARPEMESLSTVLTIHLKAEQTNFSFSEVPSSKIDTYSQGRKMIRFFSENVDETETELASSTKKQDGSNHYFITSFYAQSPEYLCCNGKNSLAFCKQLSFFPATQRHILFQIFRI